MKVGFIGLGQQGTPIARRIAEAGIPVTVWARRPEVVEQAAAWGAEAADSPAALGAACDVVGICVFDAAAVEEVLFGPDGVIDAATPDTVVLMHTTLSPADARRIAERAAQHDVVVLDAPVSGGPNAAAAGELVVLLGGPTEIADAVRPVVDAYAGHVISFAEIGSAQHAKLVNNGLLAAQVALVVDAVRLGAQGGVDSGQLLDVLRNGSARSYAADLFAMFGSVDRLAGSHFKPTVGKDVQLFLDAIEQPSALADLAMALIRQLDSEGVATT